MKRLTEAEWLRLRSLKSTWFTALAIVVLTAGIAAADAGDGADHETFVGTITLVPAVGLALLGAAATAAEYRYGTIAQRALAAPQRARMLAAKVVAMAAIALLVTTVGMIAAAIAATEPVTAATAAKALSGATLLAVLGVAVGFLSRNQTTAVLIVTGVWLGEKIVDGLTQTTLGPYGLLDALTTGEALAGVALAALTAATVVAANAQLARRDVI